MHLNEKIYAQKETLSNKVRTQEQDFLRLCTGYEKCYVSVILYVIRFLLNMHESWR